MKKIIAIILLVLVHSLIYAQPTSKSKNIDQKKINPLAGTWRLVEFTDQDTLTGKWENRYGKHPTGYFTYTKSNIVNLNICADTPLKISMDSAKKFSINYFNMTEHNAVGYFGTYSIDWEKSIVTHHVKGGSLPWYIDTDQPRPFALKGDTLIIGNNKTWRRVLVRAD